MYENEAMSNEIAVNVKRNNEVLVKNINRMGDIGKKWLNFRLPADGRPQAAQLYQAQDEEKQDDYVRHTCLLVLHLHRCTLFLLFWHSFQVTLHLLMFPLYYIGTLPSMEVVSSILSPIMNPYYLNKP